MRTYGTAKLLEGEWHVEAEPHVAIRLRRLFKAAGRQRGVVRLTATDEVSRDLQWFAKRYPLKFDRPRELSKRARRFVKRQEAFDDILSGRRDPRPFEMVLPPRPYQKIAAELALQMGGLLVADDVGLGKTASSIAMLTEPDTRPALVVTLTHLPRQWEAEVQKFAPTLRTAIVRKGTPYDLLRPRGRRRRTPQGQTSLLSAKDAAAPLPDVIIVNYAKLGGWAETLAGKVRTVVFDECQELRRDASVKYRSAKLIADAAHYRLGLSATPIYNFGIEIFNVMGCLRHGALGSRAEFIEEWCRGAQSIDPNKVPIADPKAFGTYAREAGLMIRRTRTDVGRELPHLTKSVVHVETDPKALDAVSADVAELARVILEQGTGFAAKGRAARDLDWKLRQATGVAKAPYVAEFVKLLVESGEQVVLYAWHREVYSILEDRLKAARPAFYTGTESQAAKDASVQRFLAGEARVLIMSLRSGAGLDGLQGHCRTVVFGELDWSPGVHEQAIGRVHRDGQGEPVVAYYLVSDDGADPVIMDVLGVKKEQVEGLRDPTGAVVASIATDAAKRLAAAYLKQRGIAAPARGGADAGSAPPRR